jgi:PTS system fructose-specific IIC component
VTAVGGGVAFPHVRTLQVKSFVMAFGRSREGLPFEAPDEEPVRLFFAMAAPPYDDRTYLKVYRSLAKLLLDPEHHEQFLLAEEPSEILRALELVR